MGYYIGDSRGSCKCSSMTIPEAQVPNPKEACVSSNWCACDNTPTNEPTVATHEPTTSEPTFAYNAEKCWQSADVWYWDSVTPATTSQSITNDDCISLCGGHTYSFYYIGDSRGSCKCSGMAIPEAQVPNPKEACVSSNWCACDNTPTNEPTPVVTYEPTSSEPTFAYNAEKCWQSADVWYWDSVTPATTSQSITNDDCISLCDGH